MTNFSQVDEKRYVSRLREWFEARTFFATVFVQKQETVNRTERGGLNREQKSAVQRYVSKDVNKTKSSENALDHT